MAVDALVRKLNTLGYQAVLLPRTGLEPPDLYGFHKPRLHWYGPLRACLDDPPAFAVSTARHPDIEQVTTTRKSYRAAADFLADALACFGVGITPAALDLSLVGSDALRFAFRGVVSRTVAPVELFGVIDRIRSDTLPEELARNGQLHIAYEYLYAESLLLQRADGQAIDAEVSSRLNAAIDVSAGLSIQSERNQAIVFHKPDSPPVAVGYRAGVLLRREAGWAFYPGRIKREQAQAPESIEEPYIPREGIYLKAVI